MANMASISNPVPMRDPLERLRSTTKEDGIEDPGDYCRICRGEGTHEQPLYHPCKCSGSIKFVHQDCLMEWLSHSQKKYCELCKTPFRFTKLYDQSMPENVPWPLFMRQSLIHSSRTLGRWLRYSLAISIWLCWLPWTIRQIWRGLFWIADGSWSSIQEMQAATETYPSHTANESYPFNSSLASTASDVTVATPGGATFSILLPTMSAVLGLLDPKTFLRAILRLLVSIAFHPTIVTEPINWSGGAVLLAHISRPPSLLSDFQSIASATRFPILNNALIDVLEGQLVCLAIITAFILVFLIREWVINQQPLLNMPDAEHAENPAPAQQADEPRRAARRRRRNLRRLPALDDQPGDRLVPPAHPHIRRAATENNILVQNHENAQDRPEGPQRAASLVPALQEMEDTARLLGEYQNMTTEPPLLQESPLESPPLQRGVFDEVGYIRRTIEEREGASSRDLPEVDGRSEGVAPSVPTASEPPPADDVNVPIAPVGVFDSQIQTGGHLQTQLAEDDGKDEDGWVSDSGTDIVPTPQTSTESSPGHSLTDSLIDAAAEASADQQPNSDDREYEDHGVLEEPQIRMDLVESETLWTKISNWLWHVEDAGNDESLSGEGDDNANVVNVDGQDLFAPAEGQHAGLPGIAPAVPDIPQEQPQDLQNGGVVNNADAADDAEDLEGIMELLGMEGPLAGMIQNIIFSVFLITLTLSASIWCPYIWGKITLLFIAHPFSVFVKAPLYLLSRTADVIIDIGLFIIGVFGVLVNQFTKLAKISLSVVSPRWGKYINPEILDRMSISLSQKSGARLEKTFAKAILGFRPDLPMFSIQAHHVLRVFKNTGSQIFSGLVSSLLSYTTDVVSTLTWQKIFTAPVKMGTLLREMPKVCLTFSKQLTEWHGNLQNDLRPLSFSKLDEIDVTLVQWSSNEKVACIALGYTLFAALGYIYLRVAPYIHGLRKDEKVSGFLADTLRQAGGVMKVIIIIGIEMIIFPLYCGTMLDFALLPIFEGANVSGRLRFFSSAPLTALFVHWFIGTCYMFHFALFVSMCRKIMRKGVLYFIRDPDDPTFHPVRDVLERPVATQLGKIAFSAFVYGSLLVICLGGVVAGLNRVGRILPLRWGVSDSLVIMPGDIVFFNFIFPFVLRKVDISEKLSTVFEWWFRACAAGLRLSDFMFGVDDEQEKKPAPFLWKLFFNRLFVSEEPNPVTHLKEVAKYPERLLWFESEDASTIEKDVLEIAGSDITFKNIHQFKLDGKAQALLEFEDNAIVKTIQKEISENSGRTRLRAKSISEIQIDIRSARDTEVDLTAGSYVRAPAKDSVRIPKGTKVFIQVNERDERLDGAQDNDDGLHGKKNDKFSRIYVPNHFKARVLTFVAMVWGFAAISGLMLTVGPLLLGRYVVSYLTDATGPVNDIYAITIGLHTFSLFGYLTYIVGKRWRSTTLKLRHVFNNLRQALPWTVVAMRKISGLMYLAILLGVALPLALSFIAELYINIPLFAHLLASEQSTLVSESTSVNQTKAPIAGFQSTPIINLVQTWTLGLLYLRLTFRLLKTIPHEDSRPAIAIRSITRRGLLNPDVRLATRAIILPVAVVCLTLLLLPPLATRIALSLYPYSIDKESRVAVYRYSYPAVLSVAAEIFVLLRLRKRIETWRISIRDEVYLIGERLHNFPIEEDRARLRTKKRVRKSTSTSEKGKGRAHFPDQDRDEKSKDTFEGLQSLNLQATDNTKVFQYSDPDYKLGNLDGPLPETVDPSFSRVPENYEPRNPSDSNSSLKAQIPESKRSSSGSSGSGSRASNRLAMDIDDFRDTTGLYDIADVNDMGDVGRQIFDADERSTDSSDD